MFTDLVVYWDFRTQTAHRKQRLNGIFRMKCSVERSASRYRRLFNNPMRDHFETSLDSPRKFIKSRCVRKDKRDLQSSFAKDGTNVAYNWIFYHRNWSSLDSFSVHLRSAFESGRKMFRSSVTTNVHAELLPGGV